MPSHTTKPRADRVSSRLLIPGLVALALVLASCSKPPPPKPKPVVAPPPPPPPALVSIDTIAQELKADARVQFASGLEFEESRIELAKAVVRLADAFARGDAKAARALLTRNAQTVLSDLEASGGWEESTKRIEAVRVVLVKDGVDVAGVAEAPAANTPDYAAIVRKAIAGLPEDAKKTLEAEFATIPQAGQKDWALKKLDIAMELAKTAGAPDEAIAAIEDQKSAINSAAASSGPAAAPTSSALGVLLAIQEPDGAYLLGWSANPVGTGWVFANAPAMRDTRARASAFDGIGAEGFQALRLAAAVSPPSVATPPKKDDAASDAPPPPRGNRGG